MTPPPVPRSWPRTARKALTSASLIAVSFALHLPAQAQGAPKITPSLKAMLGGLPIAGLKDEVNGMVGALKQTSCGPKFTGCFMTKSGPFHLYFFSSGTAQQTFLVVIDKTMAMPKLLGDKAQKVMGESSLSSPIISISTTDFELDNIHMPQALKDVVRDNYFNVNTLSFSSGVQVAARTSLGGALKLTMEAMGVNTSALTMRAGVVVPIPADLMSGAGAGAGMADAMAHGETMKKSGADALKPEAFVELQFGPNTSIPMKFPKVTLTDATFFLNNALTFGFKGNAYFWGAESKKVIMQFQTPLTPAGAMDLLDFEFRMATPASFTMEDGAHMMVAMATPEPRLAQYGGGFIRNIESFKNPLLAMTKPLAVVKLENPNAPPPYVFGDSTKPFPTDDKYFNFVILGPTSADGPLLKAAGDVKILGMKMGWLFAQAGRAGLSGDAGEQIRLKLGPLGPVDFKMQATMAINAGKQEINLLGNLAGQKIAVGMDGAKMKVEVSASCVNPFEIKTSLEIKPTTDIAQVFEGQGGVNVDPSKISGCIGKELEAAYRKISNEYKHLAGYSANQANEALKQMAGTAEYAAAQAQKQAEIAAAEAQKQAERAAAEAAKQAEAARQTYENTKNAARDVANKTSNAANNAFKDAGNAFKKIGKKKKHKKGPDPRFAASVFDWDYYYDNAPDVVKGPMDLATHWQQYGFNEGRQGSPEFNVVYYRNRYLDVQGLCGASDKLCALNHWLDYGIRQGRQGSANFSVASYLNRYPDLQNAFGKGNYEDALDHWFNNGEDEGRDPRPESTANIQMFGPVTVGGGGGSAWDDSPQCAGGYVTRFQVRSGRMVDGLAFLYSSGAWGLPHGNLGKPPYTADVSLQAGEYITRVDTRSGGALDSIAFVTNLGRSFGPYGGSGGSIGYHSMTAGQKLGCMQGRAGSSIDQLTISSTGPR